MRARILSLSLIAGALWTGTPVAAASLVSPPRPTRTAAAWRQIPWETSLAAARAKAARSGKPILLLHLFGRLDEEFC